MAVARVAARHFTRYHKSSSAHGLESGAHQCVSRTIMSWKACHVEGAFDTMDKTCSWSQQQFKGNGAFGHQIFLSMSETCMELTNVKRQNSSQSCFKGLLQRLRVGESTEEDVDYLMDLHLSNYSQEQVDRILNTGTVMHLFATKAPRNDHNYKRLSEISSADNPVALVRAHWKSSKCKSSSTIANHFQNPPPNATLLCRGAIVRIVDKNFEPKWGLYNNAIGTIIDIVFAPGHDPNNGDLPQYVVVEFRHYTGPAWLKDRPKVRKICEILYIPRLTTNKNALLPALLTTHSLSLFQWLIITVKRNVALLHSAP